MFPTTLNQVIMKGTNNVLFEFLVLRLWLAIKISTAQLGTRKTSREAGCLENPGMDFLRGDVCTFHLAALFSSALTFPA